ncbi:MAG: hypothetical protein KatS3mg002_0074 [Candidatus Woesearchaeota archaeon]|nr:MAG: hypothetical protein KatS3mg002_0074 [Candidatus Woesearchaeota archaeon]
MFIIFKEGLRIFKRNVEVKLFGFKKFSGNSREICTNIIDKCWNNKILTTTVNGNYYFYSRDFGMCSEALIDLGYKDRVIKTLTYVMRLFSKYNAIYVAISTREIPFNFPNKYSPDSVAYILRAIRISKDKNIILKYNQFLNKEIEKFEERVIDKNKGIVKNESFSGMRDYEIANSSCYDMIMACLLHDEIERINSFMKKKILDNKLKKYNLKNNLIKYYWNKKGYFNNSIEDTSITAHCNIFPFWLGIINNKEMLKKSLKSIEKEGLIDPLPAKYSKSKHKFIWQEILVPNWESTSIWSWLGMTYIELLLRLDKEEREKAKEYFSKYSELISKNGFVELYDEKLRPYSSLFFTADNTMIWASLFLSIEKKL